MISSPDQSRRSFLRSALAAGAASTMMPAAFADHHGGKTPFKISLAEWSLNKMIRKGDLKNMDFPQFSKERCGIDAVEYVNQLFADGTVNDKYFRDLKKRCDDIGVKSLLIMCDGLGKLGDPDSAKRHRAVLNHALWINGAQALGCHSIRVNASSTGKRVEQEKLAADGLASLSELAKPYGMNIVVENHGGLSSDGSWLSSVMKRVNMPNCGTLPDFGNFNIGGGKTYDRYKGVTELMPFAKAVSAKSNNFDSDGNETKTDFYKMMDIVLKAGYNGYVGIEYEGGKIGELEGILATKKLLESVRAKVNA
ncbi:TIM barrel protein [Verrucomicrobiales bacterium]|nr:TIM barrel protein [Verrucomicrobiales bacterium]MDA7666135.1 TIM barrel protein [bacterium]